LTEIATLQAVSNNNKQKYTKLALFKQIYDLKKKATSFHRETNVLHFCHGNRFSIQQFTQQFKRDNDSLYAFICNSNDFFPSYVDGIENSEAELLSLSKKRNVIFS
jgi:hypothetical protein